ncbi:MAG: hypothetical protein HYS04_01915 [Acidobacteria bacterium]|nr:hypothetical protein [Acidobacteriota bacterium]
MIAIVLAAAVSVVLTEAPLLHVHEANHAAHHHGLGVAHAHMPLAGEHGPALESPDPDSDALWLGWFDAARNAAVHLDAEPGPLWRAERPLVASGWTPATAWRSHDPPDRTARSSRAPPKHPA